MSALGKAGTIGVTNTRRFARDRLNLFFVFVFPVAMVLVIGLQFGGDQDPRLGVVGEGGGTGTALMADVEAGKVDVVMIDDEAAMRDRVASTDLDAGVVLPDDLDAELAAGRPVVLDVVLANSEEGQQMQAVVSDAASRVAAPTTAAAAAVERGAEAGAAAAAAEAGSAVVGTVTVDTVTTGDRLFPEGLGQYDVAAPGLLVLFVFVNGLTGATALIETRRLGVSRRMMSTPTAVRTIIAGEGLGRWIIAMIQAVYILVATMALFGMGWGDPIGAAAVLVAVSAVAAGAAMLFGSVFSKPEQAGAIGVVVALALGALGGAMLPIELFGDTLARVARLTPHYWAIDAFAELIRHDGSIVDILPQLGILIAMAAGLLLIASWRLRSAITRGH
jgi:ABC-2 type transport system permease protein